MTNHNNRNTPHTTHLGWNETTILFPHDGEEPDDVLLYDTHALPHQVDHEGVGAGLHGMSVPLLVFLGLSEGLLAVLEDNLIEAQFLTRPINGVA